MQVSSSRGGFTLIETVLVMVVLGILVAISVPRISSAVTREEVRSARVALVSLYQQARVTAIQSGRTATLEFNADSAWIAVGGAPVGIARDMSRLYGVSVISAPARFAVSPTGLLTGGGGTVEFFKRGVRDSLVVNGYGRVQ